MSSTYLSAAMMNHQQQPRFDQAVRKILKPGTWGMMLCVASFMVASVLLAFVGFQWQEHFSTVKLDAKTTTLSYTLDDTAYIELAPGAKAKVVEYTNRREVYMLAGTAVFHVAEHSATPISLHVGKKTYLVANATVQVSLTSLYPNRLASTHTLLVLRRASADALG